MDLFLKTRNVIVTGATKGIGLAIAESFANEGCNLAICARNREEVNKTVQNLRAKKVKVIGEAIDVSDAPAFKAWVKKVGEFYGEIHIVVSNVGGMVTKNNEKDWEINFKTDVMGAVNLVESAKPYLEKAAASSGDAAIIFISSIAALNVEAESSYGPMKAALIHFAKGIARQQASKFIRANVISPGSIYFEGGHWECMREIDPSRFERTLKSNPLGRFGKPEEIGDAAAFLASPRSAFTTGINLIIDGACTTRVNF
jgi:3-oxoacyl-[acyl-carrier protein] reductase